MADVFIGSAAVADGRLTEHELRRWYQAIFRDVYLPRRRQPTLRDRVAGALLRTGDHAVIAGVAASALHGARWVDDDVPVEVIAPSIRPQRGLVVRNEAVAEDEVTRIAGLPVTTATRTAYDLGRHLPRGPAVARLDALRRAAPFTAEGVLALAGRHPGARGIRRLRAVLPLVDAGAASPKETWLRLLLIDAGFPIPTTQIPVCDGRTVVAVLDTGWEEFMVAVEYDGDQHRTDRPQYVKDIRRHEFVSGRGWLVVRVVAEDRPHRIIARVDQALGRRGYHRDRR